MDARDLRCSNEHPEPFVSSHHHQRSLTMSFDLHHYSLINGSSSEVRIEMDDRTSRGRDDNAPGKEANSNLVSVSQNRTSLLDLHCYD